MRGGEGEEMRKRERVYFRVTKEATLAPADTSQSAELRRRRYKVGDILVADLRKPRNPKFNGLVHKLGELVTKNIEAFAGIDPHSAIKRLQLEGKIACDELAIQVPGFGAMMYLVPRSLSFESMDEAEFQDAARAICRVISERYWPDCTAAKIEHMANSGLMVDE